MENKNSNIGIISLAVIALAIVGVIGYMLLNYANTPSINTTESTTGQSTTGYEPQTLTFDNKSAKDTIDNVLNDSDKGFTATTNDQNFQDLDTSADFGVN